MNFRYGKFVAFGLLLMVIAGCSKERPLMEQAEIDQNKKVQQHMKENQQGSR